ncbi:MAG: carbohydrate kinase family protein [Clostridia bacterium]|nr:carbohydrate kinase family protein [Clostridia bacterium]
MVDTIKKIDAYPDMGMLANVQSIEKAVGGCVPNTLINLARMETGIPLTAIGRMGDDEGGKFILDQLNASGADTEHIHIIPGGITGFSDVMTKISTGERAFFHCRGENAHFEPEEVPLESLSCRILHTAYILLLDKFDEPDPEYGTQMARYLKRAQDQGIETSIDVVSDKSGLFQEKVLPALKYADYAIMNEIEGCAAAGLEPRDENGALIEENITKALEAFIEKGVRKRAVIHCPEAGYCMEADGSYTRVATFRLPDGYIKGSVGAGDAFAAGCLAAIYEGANAKDMLLIGAAAGAANLSEADSISGMVPMTELKKRISEWELNV